MIVFDQGRLRFNYRIAGVAIHKGRVLVHRGEQDDFWALPGGRGEFMERATDTLRREMHEEIDVVVGIGRLLWVVEDFFEFQERSFHELALYFLMTLPMDCPLLAQDRFYGVEERNRLIFEWHNLDELPALKLYPAFLRTGLQKLPQTPRHVVETTQ
jgi:ADP-ribose pyrophosphatase YjhB (NUDIX family)